MSYHVAHFLLLMAFLAITIYYVMRSVAMMEYNVKKAKEGSWFFKIAVFMYLYIPILYFFNKFSFFLEYLLGKH